jgi:FlaG/FlaF family flagellin (archaellin)
MSKTHSDSSDDDGVSPVIGIILMVGISVALVVLASTVVFNIGGNGDESSAGYSVDTEPDPQSDRLITRVSKNPDLERVFIRGDGIAGEQDIVDSKGETGTATISPSSTDGTVEIVGETEDGSEQILDIQEYEGFSGTGIGGSNIAKGTVKVENQVISSATVEALDSEGNIIGTNTTDQNGFYKFDKEGIERVRAVANNIQPSSLSDSTVISNPLYASAVKQKGSKSKTVDFNFGSGSDTECTSTVDGTTLSIILNQGGDSKLQIGSVQQLQAIKDCGLDKDYALISDIDASVTSSWNSGSGFEKLGNFQTSFTGSFDGNDKVITGLFIDNDQNRVGLFGKSKGTIENVGLESIDVTGGSNAVGGLVGRNEEGIVSNSYTTGSVSTDGFANDVGGLVGKQLNFNPNPDDGRNFTPEISDSYSTATVTTGGFGSNVGGLLGANDGGNVTNSNSNGTVTSNSNVGGLVGRNDGRFVGTGNIINSNSSATVTGDSAVGGLVGFNSGGNVSKSFATGSVEGVNFNVGGLIGNSQDSVSKSYATGNVNAGEADEVGGLIGVSGANVTNSYATGNVNGNDTVGGLMGIASPGIGKTVSTSYAVGAVTGDSNVSGAIASVDPNGGTVTDAIYWDKEATGQTTSDGLPDSRGLTTAEMQGSSASTNMGGLDFANNWSTVSGDYPVLKSIDKEKQVSNR